MAKDAVDFAIGPRAKALPSITDRIPLWGAEGLKAVRRQARSLAERYGWDKPLVEHLLHRYGAGIYDLVEAIDAQPDLARPLEHAPAYLRAEIHFAATHEQVLHLEDVMMHRTRLVYEVADAGLAAAPEIAAILADVNGWDAERVTAEISSYRDRVNADAAASLEDSDAAAIGARAAATDIAPMVPLGHPQESAVP
ncbi:hypothetical protein GCM10025876_03510 [Demequina litorisediminis]|uniref:Alpha-glycerophosphate oxidase C-terminal domain-containing protein n=1 Tax=Demequina litorisediminis TaxID=1849022 RepID=A0ABQ6IAY7_9MICO|nr:hypothetical protein GCM10025876_03510 [Demequina litorisediminis]